MLARKYRLNKEKDIKNVLSKGRTVRGSLFFIKFHKNDLAYSRVAISVPKKVSIKATDRNLIKRRIADSIPKNFLPKNNVDILIVALPTILEKQFKEIKAEIDKTTKIVFGQTTTISPNQKIIP